MSIVNTITDQVKSDMNKYAEQFKQDAIKRVDAREVPPANEMERGWAIDSEWNSIQSELVKEAVHEAWVEMFKQTIDQATSSYDREFEAAMLEAIQTTHRHIQSEFWLRMLKVMESVATADDCYFDPRNAWTKDFLARMIFAYKNSTEVDILRCMTEKELWEFRIRNRK